MKLWLPAAALATSIGLAAPAAAQFTASVAPPPRATQPTDTAKDSAAAPRTDTTLTATLLDLKTWVDSAAGAIAPEQTTDAESYDSAGAQPEQVALADRPAATNPPRPREKETTEFRDGAPAPATATLLPLLTLLGVGAMLAGTVLRRW